MLRKVVLKVAMQHSKRLALDLVPSQRGYGNAGPCARCQQEDVETSVAVGIIQVEAQGLNAADVDGALEQGS